MRPRDFNPLHHCWSVPELYSPTPLLGDEPIEVSGALPEGLWRFRLPRYAVTFGSVVDGRTTAHPTHLSSLLIDTETRAVELCWRASIRLPRKWERISKIIVLGEGKLPEEVIRGVEGRRSDGSARAGSE